LPPEEERKMYLLYSDESGDPGVKNSPVRYFILSGIIIHELRWKEVLYSLIEFRRLLRETKGLKLREEIHAESFINKPGKLKRIKRNDRLDILKKCLDWAASQPDLNVITVCIDKSKRNENVFDLAWRTFIQRFENTLSNNNFRGPRNPDDRGIILSDNTDGIKLTKLLRKMRRYNPIPHNKILYGIGYRNIPLEKIIGDPVYRDSAHSFFHQIVDVISYSARQIYETNSYMKKKGGRHFYERLKPILVTEASRKHPLGIVEI